MHIYIYIKPLIQQCQLYIYKTVLKKYSFTILQNSSNAYLVKPFEFDLG